MENRMIINNLNETDIPQEQIAEIMTEPIDLKAIYLAGQMAQAVRSSELFKTYTEGEN